MYSNPQFSGKTLSRLMREERLAAAARLREVELELERIPSIRG